MRCFKTRQKFVISSLRDNFVIGTKKFSTNISMRIIVAVNPTKFSHIKEVVIVMHNLKNGLILYTDRKIYEINDDNIENVSIAILDILNPKL